MTEKRGVDPLDFTNLGAVDNSAKTEERNPTTKKRGSLWPWLVGGALAFGGWCLYDKKKKAQALARASEARLEAQTRAEIQPGQKAQGNHPGLKIRGQEGFSVDNRFEAMGENPEGGSNPLARENWKEL